MKHMGTLTKAVCDLVTSRQRGNSYDLNSIKVKEAVREEVAQHLSRRTKLTDELKSMMATFFQN